MHNYVGGTAREQKRQHLKNKWKKGHTNNGALAGARTRVLKLVVAPKVFWIGDLFCFVLFFPRRKASYCTRHTARSASQLG